jgi:RNA polymerase sigma-70 factor, ECF subfamily
VKTGEGPLARTLRITMRSHHDFALLALPHLASVYRLAYHVGGAERADDLTQETFLRAWTHFDQFDARTNCRAWLFRILHNASVSQWRKTRREVPIADVEDVVAEPGYEWQPERAELSFEMKAALRQLPEAYRWAVWLADVEELTYQEIAATLECPVGTVMSRISRGRRMLAGLFRGRRAGQDAGLKIVKR